MMRFLSARVGFLFLIAVFSASEAHADGGDKNFQRAKKAREKQKYEKSFELFTMAAEEGSIGAQYWLGLMHRWGEPGATRDLTLALQLWRKSAKEGFVPSMMMLGYVLHNDTKFVSVDSEAFYWFEQAGNMGDPSGYTALANHYYCPGLTKPLPQDTLAFYYATKAALGGDNEGMDALGQCYRNGKGTIPSVEKAREWLTKAIAAGNISAKTNLAGLDGQERAKYAYELADDGSKEWERLHTLPKSTYRPSSAENTAYNEWWERTYGKGGSANSTNRMQPAAPPPLFKKANNDNEDHKKVQEEIYRSQE